MNDEFSKFCADEVDTLVLFLEVNDVLTSGGTKYFPNKVLRNMRRNYKRKFGIKHARDIIGKEEANIKWAPEIAKLIAKFHSIKDIDDEIKLVWPEKIEIVGGPFNSKKRNGLRQHYSRYIHRKIWEAQNLNATCANCAHLSEDYEDSSVKICDLHTDWWGKAIVKRPTEEDCSEWRRKL